MCCCNRDRKPTGSRAHPRTPTKAIRTSPRTGPKPRQGHYAVATGAALSTTPPAKQVAARPGPRTRSSPAARPAARTGRPTPRPLRPRALVSVTRGHAHEAGTGQRRAPAFRDCVSVGRNRKRRACRQKGVLTHRAPLFGERWPTDPGPGALGQLRELAHVPSVRPQPSHSSTPVRAANASRTAGGSGAAPTIGRFQACDVGVDGDLREQVVDGRFGRHRGDAVVLYELPERAEECASR